MTSLKKTPFAVTVALGLSLATPVWGQDGDELRDLLAEMANPETTHPDQVEARIHALWSKSGSRSMDLLLQRGEAAIEQEDYRAAVEHLTAVTDHAPEFAEAWNMRATAFFLMEEYGLALNDLSRAITLNPNHFNAAFGIGVILEEFGEYDHALRAFRMVQDLNPHQEGIEDAINRLLVLSNGRDI